MPAEWAPNITVGKYWKFDTGEENATVSPAYARTSRAFNGYRTRAAIVLNDPTYECWVSYYDDEYTYKGHDDIATGVHYIPAEAIHFGVSFRRVDQDAWNSDDTEALLSALSALAPTDATLTMQGMAADAKTVGEQLTRAGGNFFSCNDDVALVETYDEVIALYDELVTKYPEYISKNTLTHGGFSNYEYVLTIGNYNTTGQRGKDAVITKPTVLMTSGVHGYERSAVMSLYGFVKAMCENVYSLTDIT